MKILSRHVVHHYKKKCKDIFIFSRKSKKLSESKLFQRCCNGKPHISDQLILVTSTQQYISNLLYKKVMRLSFMHRQESRFYKTKFLKWKFTVSIWWPPMHYIFAVRYILCQETYQKIKKMESYPLIPIGVSPAAPGHTV